MFLRSGLTKSKTPPPGPSARKVCRPQSLVCDYFRISNQNARMDLKYLFRKPSLTHCLGLHQPRGQGTGVPCCPCPKTTLQCSKYCVGFGRAKRIHYRSRSAQENVSFHCRHGNLHEFTLQRCIQIFLSAK